MWTTMSRYLCITIGCCLLLSLTYASTTVVMEDSIHFELFRREYAIGNRHVWPRRRLAQTGFSERVPLNIGTGTHYTWIYVGTPPQRQSIIIDTGSKVLAFPCEGCPNCGKHTDPPYDMTKSSTSAYVPCHNHASKFNCIDCDKNDHCIIRQSYSEGSSWTATLVEDIAVLGNKTYDPKERLMERFGTRVKFGCQTSETGLFTTQISDGIMGMSDYETTLVSLLQKRYKLTDKQFALCFTKTGGSMVIGTPDTAKHKGPIQYAHLVLPSSNHWYTVNLKDVKVGGTSIGVNPHKYNSGKRVIIDSGTTDSYLPSSVADAFKEVYAKVAGHAFQESYGACQGPTKADMLKLPHLQLVMEGSDGDDIVLDISPDKYMEKKDNGRYCSNLYLTEPSGGIIGANFMDGFDVIIDATKQVAGFVPANCTFPAERLKKPFKPAKKQPAEKEKEPPATEEKPSTEKPTEKPTKAPTEKPTKAPTKQPTKVPTDKSTEPPTKAPAKKKPPTDTLRTHPPAKPTTTTSDTNSSLLQNTTDIGGSSGLFPTKQEHPAVLTIVGVITALLFFLGAYKACTSHKRKKTRWTRLEADDDDEDGLGLVSVTADTLDQDGEDDTEESSRPSTYHDEATSAGIDNMEDFHDEDDDFFDTQLDDEIEHDESQLDRL